MTDINKRFIGVAASLLVGLAAAGATMGASQASNSDGPLSCAIETSRAGGTIAIRSVAGSERGISGSYSFSVRGSGTNINQGGPFEVAAGKTVTLGQVMVGGGSYDARLEVSAGGRTVSCSERIGSI